MGINKSHYGHDLCGPTLFIAENINAAPFNIIERPRIGVDYAGEWALKPLRFYIEGNPYISKK